MSDLTNLYAGWLGDLPGDFSQSLVAIGRRIQLDPGQIVFCNGDVDTDIYGISHGTARMQIAMNEHEQRLGHIIGPGFWFGDNEFVSGFPRIMEIEAATELHLLQISRSDFLQLALDFSEAWRWIALLLAQHLIISVGAADDLMLASSEKRLAAVLLRFSGYRLGHPNSPLVEVIPATQQEIAVATNLSRASAGRILREMEENGEISIEYGALVIRDLSTLMARLS
jgi:CRP/FNR family transcriptional regulator, cyclic AMP receptor protein